MENPRPHGTIKAWKTGHAFFPEKIREELGIEEDGRIPYFLNSETILLTRKQMTLEELLAEIDALKLIIIRRSGKAPNNGLNQTQDNGEADPGSQSRIGRRSTSPIAGRLEEAPE
jgi:bifunctional DNA-binding transcriptional regulator/antitoxin component of YhaV-PrlF toxin-antitoxin module